MDFSEWLGLLADPEVREGIATALEKTKAFLQPVLGPWGDLIKTLGGILAPFITILAGGYAIVHKRRYAERNLPTRLQEYQNRRQSQVAQGRETLRLAALLPSSDRQINEPIYRKSHLKHAIRRYGVAKPRSLLSFLAYPFRSTTRKAEANITVAITELQNQIKQQAEIDQDRRDRLSIALLIEGAQLASDAAKAADDEQRRLNLEAKNRFSQAVEINPTDLEAELYLAQQLAVLGDNDVALERYKNLVQSAIGKSQLDIAAEAEKGAALLHELKGATGNAKDAIERGIDHLQAHEHDTERLADFHELAARMHGGLGNNIRQSERLTEAERLYRVLGERKYPSQIRRIEDELRTLRQANHSPPQPTVPANYSDTEAGNPKTT
ncbi:MAG: hypothetical protein JXQ99_04160 [Hyphomicrobiaceae bacterium]